MTTIKLKNGSGAPTSGDLAQGEPALDLTNKRLYTEDSGGTVIEVGTNPGVDVTFADNRKASLRCWLRPTDIPSWHVTQVVVDCWYRQPIIFKVHNLSLKT